MRYDTINNDDVAPQTGNQSVLPVSQHDIQDLCMSK